MMKKVQFKAGKEMLSGFILAKSKEDTPTFLFLHGAGVSTTKEKNLFIAKKLLKHSISSFLFDFSGHGESTGNLTESSLKKRVFETLRAVGFLDKNRPITICGVSMGGYIALKLLEYADIANLILLCPAIYDRRAFNVKFGQKFSEIIRKKNSWKNSDVLSSLEKFTGKLLIVIGKEDKIIPSGVIELLGRYSANVKRKQILRLPDVPHQINPWLEKNPLQANKIIKVMLEFAHE